MKSISAAAIAFSLVIGSITTAQADERQHDNAHHADHWDDREHRDDRRDNPDNRRDYGNQDKDWNKVDSHDRDYRNGYPRGRYDGGRYIRPRGYYQHSWRRGERLPAAYYGNRYVVRNYSAYRLHSPPRGYQWIRVDRDVVLAAVATGTIVAIVDGLFH